jgi:tetratricopeptide (TPR) repeat protein
VSSDTPYNTDLMAATCATLQKRATACLLTATGVIVAAGWLMAYGQGGAAVTPQPPTQNVTLRTILVTSEEVAEKIVTRLNDGESFVLIAKAESIAPSADNGGWLGTVVLQDLRPEVQQALKGVAPGHLTPIVRVPTGFAIFKVEKDERDGPAPAPLTPDLSSSGVIKFVADVSGFTDARVSLEQLQKGRNWNMDPRTICDARTRSLAAAESSVAAYLSPANESTLASRLPIDVMQLHVTLAQLRTFNGRMDDAITEFQKAYRLAASEIPAAALQMEESLGIAYLHKAGIDNNAYAAPGDLCLLTLPPPSSYQKLASIGQAIEHFSRYLEQNPDELEVRWLLNLAYMRGGGYPDKVPKAYLIPPSAFESAEDIGRFPDVAPQAGLRSVSSAGGVLVDDFRNTGRFDVITSTADKCGAMTMLGNNGDGTFKDRTASAGLASELGGLNIVNGDYNNDGCPDILVLRGGWEELPQRKSLLRNNCDGTFTDVTVASGLAVPPTAAQTAVWTDIDNDGFLDLFVGVESGAAQLFRNKRDGTFEDIAKAAGVDRIAYAKGVAAADYDNDRYPDLYVSHYGGQNFLYHNNRDRTFTEVSRAANVLGTPQGFATWFFDYDNDGWQDLFVTSYVSSLDEMVRDYLGMPHRATTMKLYRNLGDGSFRDVSSEAGLNRVRMPMGANYGDIDNDGYLDIYLGTGNPSYGALAGSVLLRNKDGRSFVDVTTSSGTGELHKGHGVAFADLDNDGDEDIVFEVGGMTQGDRHALRLFENPGHGNDWIALKLVGVKSNRTAVGARIKVTVKGEDGQTRTLHRTVSTGGSFGGSPLLQHIGLGRAAAAVDVEVWWPTTDTRQQFANIGKNRWLQIEEFSREYTVLTRHPVHLGGGGAKR